MTKMTKEIFSKYIEERALKENCSHIEAIISHCEETGFEVEMVKNFINKNLKSKIEEEAKNLRLISGKSATLPI